jgi:formamidopyrimidine-DNA glycosylase
MPELPEVETTLRGIAPALTGRTITDVVVRNPALRWPIPADVSRARGSVIAGCRRRAKYLVIELDGAGSAGGGLLMHLGMSGSLRICDGGDAPRKHDHYDLVLDDGSCLRFNDPRRFGALLWWDHPAEHHPLLRGLGPEPLSDDFTGVQLWRRSRGRKAAVKNFIMDGRIVVGVGNIYASEALFMAGIHPSRPAGRIALVRYEALALAIRDVLERAIRHGGTTLRDYLNSDSRPGYFAQELLVYEREGQPCFQCRTPIRRRVIGQRSSYYCHRCQR